ncbi:MAG: extracellular solute-binding protein [Candidatus Rokubacteria bacterium]|nr:extracellular solute-binding protein [Candidatus Rokubacteria bacterium]
MKSRREFLKIALAVGATAPSRGWAAGRQLEKELVFSGRGGSLGDVWKRSVIPPFEKKFNCKVTYVTNDSTPAFAKIVAERHRPQTDVLWATDQTHQQGVAMGVFEKFDASQVPNLANLYDFARYKNNVGVWWSVGAAVMEYNAQIYKERNIPAPTSWSDFWVPEVKGRVLWMDLTTLQGLVSFLMINKLAGGSEKNVDPGFNLLKSHLKDVVGIVSSPSQVDEMLQQKSAWLVPNQLARVLLLKGAGVPVEAGYPKEGIPATGLQLEVIKGAPHPNLGLEFVNWVLTDEMQLIVARDMALGPVSKTLRLDPKVAARVIYGEDKVSRLVNFDYDVIGANFGKWVERWNREFAR